MSTESETTSPSLLDSANLRQLARLAAEAVAVGLFISVVLMLATFIVATTAQASELDMPRGGELQMLQGPGEAPIAAPLIATEVRIDVAGIVARTAVTQRFVNAGDDWQEAVYVFPLPERSAVDRLQIVVGERRIEGRIRERESARSTYEQAKREGRRAALVEQQRPNVFTTRVAPIGPGEEIRVSIEYQETLRYDLGEFSLRFPLGMTPRYMPGIAMPTPEDDGGWSPNTDRVPDASQISPPVADPALGSFNAVTITATIDAGFPLARIASPYHGVDIEESPGHRYRVTLRDVPTPANRDFVLTWTPDVGGAPAGAVFVQPGDKRAYALVMVVPPAIVPDAPRAPRELTFVIDTSGSMAGTSIVQAKAALLLALDRLAGGDRFNVIEFNSRTRALFDAPMPVDAATLAAARTFVSTLTARGGTEMREALDAALPASAAPSFVRQVVFLTDGAVGNEDELFALIRSRLGDRRLFTIGIGSAPNSHFMTRAAEVGRGTFTYIGDVREVQAKMAALFRKLESPVLTDVAIRWPGRVEAFPATIPDLYAGEPLVVTAAIGSAAGEIDITGRAGSVAWRATLPLADHPEAAGVGALWARAKIDALLDASSSGATPDTVRAEIVSLALEHELVSRYTSLVAVDTTPSAPAGTSVTTTAVPLDLPHGQDYEAIFEGLPQTATPAPLHRLLGALALCAALILYMLAQRRKPSAAAHARAQ